MRLESLAIICAVRPHGEHGAIVRALTPSDGMRAGYVRGGRMHPDKCWGIAAASIAMRSAVDFFSKRACVK